MSSPTISTPTSRSPGLALTEGEVQSAQSFEAEQQAAMKHEKPTSPPPIPYKADRTGLSTSNIPKPPVRRNEQIASPPTLSPSGAGVRSKPSLPPRLPPRAHSAASSPTKAAPPTHLDSHSQSSAHAPSQDAGTSYINSGALKRLGSAGVSVPAFGIGKIETAPTDNNPWRDEKSSTPAVPASPSTISSSSVGALQGRFSKLSASSSPLRSPPSNGRSSPSPDTGTSFAQKQAAIKTASSFRNDPSSVSLTDARSAASTANNFRERHGDQVAKGWAASNSLDQKYGLSNKVGGFVSTNNDHGTKISAASPVLGESSVTDNPWATSTSSSNPVTTAQGAGGKGQPPPPPPKKVGVGVGSLGVMTPPPLPLGSKPKW